jgi:hypothetical protein
MNCVLQCLAHTQPLAEFYRTGAYEAELSAHQGSQLTRSFVQLLHALNAAAADPAVATTTSHQPEGEQATPDDELIIARQSSNKQAFVDPKVTKLQVSYILLMCS